MPQAGQGVAVPPPFDSLPYCVDHPSSRVAAALLLALLAAMAGMVIVPVALALTYAAHDLQDALVHKPAAVGLFAVGLLGWNGLLLVAGRRVVRTLWTRRSARITRDRVVVKSAGLLGATLWTGPLAEFRGIAHHVRATSSGVRHELVLVHSARNRSVLLHAADFVAQSTIDHAAALFRLPQLPARDLYARDQAVTRPEPIAALTEATQAA